MLHRDVPLRRVGVLQFQEQLNRRLMAKDGAIYLLPESSSSEQEGNVLNAAKSQGSRLPLLEDPAPGTKRHRPYWQNVFEPAAGYAAYAVRTALQAGSRALRVPWGFPSNVVKQAAHLPWKAFSCAFRQAAWVASSTPLGVPLAHARAAWAAVQASINSAKSTLASGLVSSYKD